MAETYSVEAVLTAADKGMSSTLNGYRKQSTDSKIVNLHLIRFQRR